MTTSDILYAHRTLKRIEAINYKNPNHLMSCGPRTDADVCEGVAFGGARDHLRRLAGEDYEYDDEDGYAVYAALIKYAAMSKLVEHNPERMSILPDTEFASSGMGQLAETEHDLEAACAKYKIDNGSWVKVNPDPKTKIMAADSMNHDIYTVKKEIEKILNPDKTSDAFVVSRKVLTRIYNLADTAHLHFQWFLKDHRIRFSESHYTVPK